MDTHTLFLTGQTVQTLRDKFCQEDSSVYPYWLHFLRLARREPFIYATYNVLAYLVTGDSGFQESARRYFLEFIAFKDQGLVSLEGQVHSHSVSAEIARLAIFFEWTKNTDLLSDAEREKVAACLLDTVRVVSLPQLQSRAALFENQILANAFAVAVVSHVLHSHQSSPELFGMRECGVQSLKKLFSLLPKSGYSEEGSIYHFLVVMPILLLSAMFLEECAGVEVYAKPLGEAESTFGDWLKTARNLVGPGGRLPTWDATGANPATVKSFLVYLAARENDEDALRLIRDTGMWYHNAHVAWEFDDRLWSLVLWPETVSPDTEPCVFRSWLNPECAGAIQSGQSRLFQYWDRSSGLPLSGRFNVNPNAILFDIDGIPLLFDGTPNLDPSVLNIDLDEVAGYFGKDYLSLILKSRNQKDTKENRNKLTASLISGSIGESNSVVLDDECWFVPKKEAQGKGLSLFDAGELQVIESESADYYRDRYRVSSMKRLSLMVRGQYVITTDFARCEQPYRFSWQAFTWPDAKLVDDQISASAGGTKQLRIIPGFAAETSLDQIPGFPAFPVNGSTRVRLSHPNRTTNAVMPVCLYAQDRLHLEDDISEGWSVTVNGDTRFEGIDLNSFYFFDDTQCGDTLEFSLQIKLSKNHQFVTVNNMLKSTRLLVNGTLLEPVYDQHDRTFSWLSLCLPTVYDLTNVARIGDNTLCFQVEAAKGETLKGPILLHSQVSKPAKPRFKVLADTHYRVNCGSVKDDILFDNTSTCSWQNGETDARFAMKSADGSFFFLGVSYANFAACGIHLCSSVCCDISIRESVIEIHRLPAKAMLNLRFTNCFVHVESLDSIMIAYNTATNVTLKVHHDSDRRIYIDGNLMAYQSPVSEISLEPYDHEELGAEINSHSDVCALLSSLPEDVESLLNAKLDHRDWRVQETVIDLLGRLGCVDSVRKLKNLLENANQGKPLSWPSQNWKLSKMVHCLEKDCYKTISSKKARQPVNQDDVCRWRIQRALVVALGRLGHQTAVPLLERMLKHGRCHFCVMSQIPVALARLNSIDSIELIEKHCDNPEINTKLHCQLALKRLKGALSKTEFEQALLT